MKRLKYYLLQMEENTTTYKEMYEGRIVYPPGSPGNPGAFADTSYDNTHWNGDVSFTIEPSGKLAQDKPTITVGVPAERLCIGSHTAAAADFCLRRFKPFIDELNAALYNRSRPDRENGRYYLYSPGGEVLTRNSSYFALRPPKGYDNGPGNKIYLLDDGTSGPPRLCLCLKLQVQLPYRKLRRAIQMLCRDLPDAVDKFVSGFDRAGLDRALRLEEKQTSIRSWLESSDFCAFIADGSLLPRSKGSDLPMENAVPFRSTPGDSIEVAGVRGMGIRRGVSVVTGGGYSGKSTLLDAISAGIYNHVSGDGRELAITDGSAVIISAEDGRSVGDVNISPFIKWIPGGDTGHFSTGRASGSTSQAANIMEAVNSGARLLLIDEDRSATNFMIRDKMMKELIKREPITPFTDRVRELHRQMGVSTILVIGGSGEYLSVADRIYMMDDFLISDVTAESKAICRAHGAEADFPPPVNWKHNRLILSDRFTSYPEGSGTERLEVSDTGFIFIGDEKIDTRMLHNIITPAQLTSLGFMLRLLEVENTDRKINLAQRVDDLYKKIEAQGLDFIHTIFFQSAGRFLDLPRESDLLALINRMRMVSFVQNSEGLDS